MDLFPDDNVFHEYHGTRYALSAWLPQLLPDECELSLDAWPTFCGAGDGFGDWIVRDKICGVWIKVPCLQHDLGWAVSKTHNTYFVKENWRFRYNLQQAVIPQIPWYRKPRALVSVYLYWACVATIGKAHFEPVGEDWSTNPIVLDKIMKLNRACLGFV